MILKTYIFKDIIKVQMVTMLVLISVFTSQSAINYLGQASAGSIPMDVVPNMVLYSLPSLGYILIPMTLYIGIIVSLSRMSSDSEMVVLRSVGISAISISKICLILAVISGVLTCINTLYLMPWATAEQKILSETAQNNPRYLPIESGKFTDFGDYTIYIQEVDGNDDEKQMGQVFIMNNVKFKHDSKFNHLFLTSESGHMMVDSSGFRWVVLEKGIAYRILNPELTVEKVDFTTLSVPVPIAGESKVDNESLQSLATSELLHMDTKAAEIELQWRIAPIFACFIVALMAVPLSMINPRQGKFARLGPAIILFVSYYMAILSMRNLLNTDVIPLYPGMYLVPFIFGLCVLIPLNMDKKYKYMSKKSVNNVKQARK